MNILEILKLLFSSGIVSIIMLFVYRQKRITEERDRLLEQQKRRKLIDDEEAIKKKFDEMPLDELVDSAKDIASRVNKTGRN